jgi:hypothetical protein
MQVLAALHGFWFMMFVPPVALARRQLSAAWLKIVGMAQVGLGSCGIAGIAVLETLTWYPEVPEMRQYLGRHIVFAIATAKDMPLVQLLVAGTVCWAFGIKRRDTPAPDPEQGLTE